MKTLVLSVAVTMLAAGLAVADDDYPVAVEDLPQAVSASVQAYFPGAEIVSAKTDEDDGRRTFDLKVDYKDLVLRVETRADGRIREIDMDRGYKGLVRTLGREASLSEVGVGALPQEVQGAVADIFPGSKIVSAAQGEDGGRTYYRLRAKQRSLLLRLDVRADGRVLDIDTEK